jgi:hypothetical protein
VLLIDVDPSVSHVGKPGNNKVRMIMNSADTDLDALVVGARVRIEIRATDPEMKLPFAILESSNTTGAAS